MNNNSCWALPSVCGLQGRTNCCIFFVDVVVVPPMRERGFPSLVAVDPGFFFFIL